MLRRLYIRNFLLIDETELHWTDGFTVITGETGSGKSILLGALGLVMGERAEAGVWRDGNQRCVIELEIEAMGLESWFERQELPFETHAILRRQIDPNGRSRAFINDTPVRLEQMRDLAGRVVHIHGQHHALLLNEPSFQLGLLDHLAGQHDRVRAYGALHRKWRTTLAELERTRAAEAEARQALEFMRFQCQELASARLVADEQAGLEQDLLRAEHASELLEILSNVEGAIQADQGLLAQMVRLEQDLARAGRFDARMEDLAARMCSVRIELQDIADEAAGTADRTDQDPQRTARLRERLDLLNRLQQKHRVDSVEALLALKSSLEQQITATEGLDTRIAMLAAQEELERVQVEEEALTISRMRQQHAGPLATKVEKILHELGMPDAQFRFQVKVLDAPGPMGQDGILAFFTANRDRPPAPLDRTASGGELARVMLALISLAAGSRGLRTVIFDEVDTGVSGAVAERVGRLMQRMGRDRQVIAITHLPQIAGQAAHHLEVTKTQTGENVHTRIGALEEEDRVHAIARMLSGRKVSKGALENARTLMGRS